MGHHLQEDPLHPHWEGERSCSSTPPVWLVLLHWSHHSSSSAHSQGLRLAGTLGANDTLLSLHIWISGLLQDPRTCMGCKKPPLQACCMELQIVSVMQLSTTEGNSYYVGTKMDAFVYDTLNAWYQEDMNTVSAESLRQTWIASMLGAQHTSLLGRQMPEVWRCAVVGGQFRHLPLSLRTSFQQGTAEDACHSMLGMSSHNLYAAAHYEQSPMAWGADAYSPSPSCIQQVFGICSQEGFGLCRACLRMTTRAVARQERLLPQWAWAAPARPAQRRPPRRRARRAAAQAPSQA